MIVKCVFQMKDQSALFPSVVMDGMTAAILTLLVKAVPEEFAHVIKNDAQNKWQECKSSAFADVKHCIPGNTGTCFLN